ncbi:hypothetical protein LINPERHAP2_LOCUS36195 [Linum perenne]
MVLPLL